MLSLKPDSALVEQPGAGGESPAMWTQNAQWTLFFLGCFSLGSNGSFSGVEAVIEVFLVFN